MYATRYYSTREMKLLLDRGAHPNARSKEKFTAFNFAAADRAKAEVLIDCGFDFKQGGEEHSSALMIAARHPRGFEVVSLLLSRGADANQKGPGGATALQRSVKSGDLRTVKLLVEKGAILDDPANKGLFFNSLLTGKDEIARFLMEKGADVNLSDGFAGHSLGAALVNGNTAFASELIERGADIHLARNVGDVPPIVYAAHNDQGDPALVKLLLKKGADLNARNDRDETALTWARKRGETQLVHFLEEQGATDTAPLRKRLTIPASEIHLTGENSKTLLRESVSKALAILEKGSEGFLDRQGRPDNCVSCHHQTLPGIVFGAAAKRDFDINLLLMERQIDTQKKYWRNGIKSAWEYEDPVGGAAANVSYGMLNLAANGYLPDEFTEAMSFFLAGVQLADGGWATFVGRPPAESTRLAASAFALRAIQSYPLKELKKETERREASAQDFFLKSQASSTEEHTFKLLGLFWSKASNDEIHRTAQRLLSTQRRDGGWSQIPTLESDAYATAESLVAAVLTHQLTPADPRYIRGAEFLLRTQFPDGSWLVHSRTWPFQTHFSTGFPHGRDQWISASATAWAALALMSGLNPDSRPA
ncbi:MAG: ankyrin repeat domain-containing protein, partial [Verrucomicrobiota bacterium]